MAKVLVFGDSLTFGPYGQYLEAAIKAEGHDVVRCAVGGHAAYQFLKNVPPSVPKAATSITYNQIKDKPFDIVIMSMGTNDACGIEAYRGEPGVSTVETVAGQLIDLANSFKNSKNIWWVGPPAFSEHASRWGLVTKGDGHPRYRRTLPTNANITMDLNYRSNILWNYLSGRFVAAITGGKKGSILDPRAATRNFTLKNNIHFASDGGAAWAKFTFKNVFAKDAPESVFNGVKPTTGRDIAPAPPVQQNTLVNPTGIAPTVNYNPNNATALNSGIVDKARLLQLEKLSISDNEDITTPTIDETTTIEGFLKYLTEKEHRESYLNGKKIFEGIVCRVPELYRDTNYEVQGMISAVETASKRKLYKVRVFDHDSPFLESPETFDGTDADIMRINKLKDFESPSDLILRVGDCVLVTYGNLRERTDGRIITRIPESFQDKLQNFSSAGVSTLAAFNDRQNIPTVVAAVGAHLSNGTATSGGKDLGRIMVKDINMHKGVMQTLEEKAADRFIQMREAAEKEKDVINLHLNSGFRDRAEQARLYAIYLAGGAPANKPDDSPVAGHRAGDAADIAVNSSYSSKEYLWLFKNAPNYDYYNSGRFVNSKNRQAIEPWHHQYAPPGSKALQTPQVSQAVQYHREGVPYGGNSTNNKGSKSSP